MSHKWERTTPRDPDLMRTNRTYAPARIDWRLFLGCVASFAIGVLFV